MVIINENSFNTDRESKEYLWVNNCGRQDNSKDTLAIRRSSGRKDYQFIYLQEGCGFYFLDGCFRKVEAGNLILYRPGEPQIYEYRADHPHEGYWLHFSGTGVKRLLRLAGLTEHVSEIGNDPVIAELFRRIMREVQRKSGGYQVMCAGLLAELIAQLGRKCAFAHKNEDTLTKVAPAVDYFHDHFQTEISLDDAALLCRMSKYHFIRQFTTATGSSPHAYQTLLRIQRARELLTDSTLNVSEVSEAVGYENPLYFSRIFRKYAGCSPREYRQKAQKS